MTSNVATSTSIPSSTVLPDSTWTRDTLTPSDWLLPIPAACIDELEGALAQLRTAHARPVHETGTQGLALSQCAAFMAQVRGRLSHGAMFAVLDRLPVAWSREDLTQAYWLLSSLLARPVQQTWNGTMLFDVRDVGLGPRMTPGSGIRATVTNLDLNFHNDNCFNTVMPDYVGLLCVRAAKSGGVSKTVSFQTVHEHLRAHHPDLLERLYQPVWWDRHKEFGPDEQPYVGNAVFDAAAGHPHTRFSIYNIRGGYRLRDELPDTVLEQALEAVLQTLARPEMQVQFTMEPGQIQFVNNRTIGHARTEFVDYDEPDARRHLVRLWMRDWGSVGYAG